MSCLPNTPIANNLLSATNSTDLGWVDVASVITSALSQYYPLSTGVLSFDNLAQTTNQHVVLRQLEVEETASSSANIKKCPLIIYLFNNTSPGSPSSGAVYNPSVSNLIGQIAVAQSDYKRVSDTVWVARVTPEFYFRTGTNSNASNFYATVISDSATSVTYAASAAMRIKIITEAATSL